MAVLPQYQPTLDHRSEQLAYARNPTGTADALNERIIPDCYRWIDITKFKEELDRTEGAASGVKLLIQEVASINVPKVEAHEFATMYMQRNPPGAMPGCTTTTNGDPSMGGNPIRGTAAFYEMCGHIKTSMECLPQDFGYDPDWERISRPFTSV